MSRSSYIYIVFDQDSNIVAPFTVKYEAIEFWESRHKVGAEHTVRRYPGRTRPHEENPIPVTLTPEECKR
jgi:hypothetical protein